MGSRKARRFTQVLPGLSTRSSCRLCLTASAVVFCKPQYLEFNMVKIPSSNTVPHVSVTDGQLTTTSRDIANTFCKRHDNVIDRIAKLDCSPDFSAGN